VQVLPVLKAVWLTSDQLCSKLLKAALPEWLQHHERRSAPLSLLWIFRFVVAE